MPKAFPTSLPSKTAPISTDKLLLANSETNDTAAFLLLSYLFANASAITVKGTGTPPAKTNTRLTAYDTQNSYLQSEIQNLSNGANSSSDLVATADTGTDTARYVDVGINGSGNTSGNWGAALDGYSYVDGGDYNVGTQTAGKAFNILVGGASKVSNIIASFTETLASFSKPFTGRYRRRVVTVTQSATPAIVTDNGDVFIITGLAQAVTSMTTGLTGTPVDGDEIVISFTDNGTGRAITWGTSFEASTVTLPTTTVANARLDSTFRWNAATSKWRIILKA